MPEAVTHIVQINPGDLYEDSLRHPCLCVSKEGDEISGLSLVDGSFPRTENLKHVNIRKLTVQEAWQWRIGGPQDIELPLHQQWWEQKPRYLVNPARYLENLYFFSLYQVEWHERVIAALGAPVRHEWHDVCSTIEEQPFSGKATVSFTVKGQHREALVEVKAHKSRDDWLIDDLTVTTDGNEKIVLLQKGQNQP